MAKKLIEPEQKALEINLDEKIYGTFAEIGAGQEVARHFFQVGAAAGTIAKTMSAYDKIYSDRIYGVEASGRYVCESRLYKMLDHEYDLLEERLGSSRMETNFFAFADTVSAINYRRTNIGHGWLGIRFQLEPGSKPNDLVIHARLRDKNSSLQQSAIGILGVNMLYACYHYQDNYELFIQSLLDNLEGRVDIDMIRLNGPQFDHLDNRLLSLSLVKNGLTNVAMFDKSGRNIHASEFLYKKNILVVRGSYRPATLVNMDMLKTSGRQFTAEPDVDASKYFQLTEITLDNLKLDGELSEQDFLDRATVLGELGQTVIVSNCESYPKLIRYFSDFKPPKLGIVLGVRVLLDIINQNYYQHNDGSLLHAFGELFTKSVKLYIYPALQEGSSEVMSSRNMPVPDGIKHLYQHLLENGQIEDIRNAQTDILHIYSKDVLRMLRADEKGWEKMVTPKVAQMVKDKCLFGFPCARMEFEY